MTVPTEQVRALLIELEIEHGDLNAAIDRFAEATGADDLQLRRLKKRKLQLKDQIIQLKMQLVPDIPA